MVKFAWACASGIAILPFTAVTFALGQPVEVMPIAELNIHPEICAPPPKPRGTGGILETVETGTGIICGDFPNDPPVPEAGGGDLYVDPKFPFAPAISFGGGGASPVQNWLEQLQESELELEQM